MARLIGRKVKNAIDGSSCLNFWNKDADHGKTTGGQEVSDVPAGKYTAVASVRGGDYAENEMKFQVFVNGELKAEKDVMPNNDFVEYKLENFDVPDKAKVKVAFSIDHKTASGAWSYVDKMSFAKVGDAATQSTETAATAEELPETEIFPFPVSTLYTAAGLLIISGLYMQIRRVAANKYEGQG